ncbi:MAG: hypothetical protein M0C28_24755 [Candidatus Moduliflexus flocculans]|nr:hypothetical protein [Candidatus Moduliflexus flocculans]
MGQIVFLYFLQKKGWLGVAKRTGLGHRPARFPASALAEGEIQCVSAQLLQRHPRTALLRHARHRPGP